MSAARFGPDPRVWLQAARPKTLIASVAPIAIGVAMASARTSILWPWAFLTLISAVALQIGTNYVNDLSDHLKGVDRADRVGPTRVVQAGLVSVRQMKIAIAVVMGLCVLTGLALVGRSGPFILSIGLAGVAMGFLYSLGPPQLSAYGLNELMVLAFFGVLAVAGAFYVQTGRVDAGVWLAGVGPGFLSMAILTVNNVRDAGQDARAGRRTLVVRCGTAFGRWLYAGCLAGAALVPWALWAGGWLASAWSLLASASFLLGLPVMRQVQQKEGTALNAALGLTAGLLLFYCATFSLGWLLA